MSEHPPVSVRQNKDASRFEVMVDGFLSELNYSILGNEMAITHTFVPPELRGRGIAEALVKAALATARTENLWINPVCSYAARYLERNPING